MCSQPVMLLENWSKKTYGFGKTKTRFVAEGKKAGWPFQDNFISIPTLSSSYPFDYDERVQYLQRHEWTLLLQCDCWFIGKPDLVVHKYHVNEFCGPTSIL